MKTPYPHPPTSAFGRLAALRRAARLAWLNWRMCRNDTKFTRVCAHMEAENELHAAMQRELSQELQALRTEHARLLDRLAAT